MAFSAPAWLLLLVPWAGLLFYLMLGKPPHQPVPFLRLWRGPEARRSVKPSVSKLPLWVGLLMLAAAAAVLAAAGPARSATAAPPAAGEGPAVAAVGISAAAVRADQVMVRILNRSTRRDAALELAWPGGGRTETLSLPATGEQAYFFDLPSDLPQLILRIDQHTVELTRRRASATIEPYTPLPESLRRLLSAYRSARPAGDDAVALAADEPTLAGRPGVVLAPTQSPAAGRVTVVDHPVTRDVDWPSVLAGARIAPAPAGFTPLVRIGDAPAVAVRASPRQVWVGFDAPGFASRVDYVVFWTNVLDFAGGNVDHWQPAAGTQFARAVDPAPVQKAVQNLAPATAVAAAVLTLLSLVVLRGQGRFGWVRKGQYPS